MYIFVERSSATKVGPMPVVYSARKTCPPSCGWYRDGCYGDGYHTSLAWNRADRGIDTLALADRVAQLEPEALWRYAIVGDLPGDGEVIDPSELGYIVWANRGKRGYTYTHKHQAPGNLAWIRHANDWGFTVNLSADNLAQADDLAATGAGPVVVVLPADAPERSVTPGGRAVVVCPEQTGKARDCLGCGLCQARDRAVIVGFRAHGQKTRQVSERARIIPIMRAS
jgi:hypothetical protein